MFDSQKDRAGDQRFEFDSFAVSDYEVPNINAIALEAICLILWIFVLPLSLLNLIV